MSSALPPRKIVVLTGKAGAGKTTVANYLVENYSFKRVRFGVQPMVGDDVLASYRRPNDRDIYQADSGIMVVPIVGGLVHRGDGPEAPSGLQSYTSLHNKFERLFADNRTRGILDRAQGSARGVRRTRAG